MKIHLGTTKTECTPTGEAWDPPVPSGDGMVQVIEQATCPECLLAVLERNATLNRRIVKRMQDMRLAGTPR